MKKITLLAALLVAFFSFGQITINEVDSDTPGTDNLEFIELLTPNGNVSLDGYIVVFFNGGSTGDLSYQTVDLNGFNSDSDGLFIIGNSAVANVDIVISNGSVQNGADAIVIYQAAAADFPNGTAPTQNNLVDAIVYDTNDVDDDELLAALGKTIQFNEDLNGNKENESLQFDANGGYCTTEPTLRAANSCSDLGTEDKNKITFTMYPNPTNNGFVNILSRISGEKQVSVYDVLGKQVINIKINDRLNVSKLSTGIYLVKINQGNVSVTKKLVIK